MEDRDKNNFWNLPNFSFLARKALYATVVVTLDIFVCVNVNLRCIVNNQKKISKCRLSPLGKISADPMVQTCQ